MWFKLALAGTLYFFICYLYCRFIRNATANDKSNTEYYD